MFVESLSIYNQAPNPGQIRKNDVNNVVVNFKIIKRYI